MKMFLCASRAQLSKEAGKSTVAKRQACVRAAAVQADQHPGPHLAERMPHADIWQLFCDARSTSVDHYEKGAQCIPNAISITTRVEQLVAESAATLPLTQQQQQSNNVSPPLVPLGSEPELTALYEHMKTSTPPELVAPLTSELNEFAQRVFPSAAKPWSTFKGWGTLASPDDLHVLVGHGRRQELEAYADAGYQLENSMHETFRSAEDGLACSMYDVLRLYLILNQLLLNEWDVLECLEWPSDDTLPEEAQGLLHTAKSKRLSDNLINMPAEPLMKLIIGSQLHWLGSTNVQLEGVTVNGEGKFVSEDGLRDIKPPIEPQFALSAAWMEIGKRVRDRTVTHEDIRAFCEEQLFTSLVTAEYMLAYDRRRLEGSLPLPLGEGNRGEFISKSGCWKVGSVVWQVLHLDMWLPVLKPTRGWSGYGYYNDRAPLRLEWFKK